MYKVSLKASSGKHILLLRLPHWKSKKYSISWPVPIEVPIYFWRQNADRRKDGRGRYSVFPGFQFFDHIKQILNNEPEVLVDFVALIKNAGDLVEKKTRNGNVLPMREIALSDDSTDDTVYKIKN